MERNNGLTKDDVEEILRELLDTGIGGEWEGYGEGS